MNKLEAWIRIIRPLIVFLGGFGATVGFLNVTIGSGMEWTSGHTIALVLNILGGGVISAGLMVHNDYTDLASDKVNRPNKPICCGAIKPLTAKYVGIGMMFSSVLFGLLTTVPLGKGPNWVLGIFALFLVISGIWYNVKGKYSGIFGHVVVAIGVGGIPYWGALAARPYDWTLMLPLAVAIGISEVGREIMVCIGDIKGDRVAGFRTTPVRVGRHRALAAALTFYLFSLPIFLFAYFLWGGYPSVHFGYVFIVGSVIFWLVLMVTWADILRVVLQKRPEKEIWNAFERDIRTATRLGAAGFQVLLMVEAFV